MVTPSEAIDPEPRRALKRAIAWRTLTDIIRHHPALGLRLVETHPCGGAYDCLTLVRLPAYAHLCSFNLNGTGLMLGEPIGRRREGSSRGADPQDYIWRYPQHGLGEDRGSLARDIEAWLGFSERPTSAPTPTAAGLALGVIAELLDRVALGTRPVDIRNGWFDTAGVDDVGVRGWARGLPGVAPAGAEWTDRRTTATRYWALDRSPEASHPRVVLDLATSALWVGMQTELSLADRYQRGAGVRALAWRLEEALDADAH